MIAVLILPVKGNAQTKNNKIPSNTQNIKSPTLQQKQTIKTRNNPKAQLPNAKKPPLTAKDLERKLLAANTGLTNANKALAQKDGEISKLNQDLNNLLDELDDLDKNLIKLYLKGLKKDTLLHHQTV